MLGISGVIHSRLFEDASVFNQVNDKVLEIFLLAYFAFT